MSENFHGRMMNIPVARLKAEQSTEDGIDRLLIYRYGHRDARHAAAEIANEADARIAELEAQLAAAQERERGLTALLYSHQYATIEAAAEKAGMTVEEFRAILNRLAAAQQEGE